MSTQLFFLRDFRQNKGTILKASVDYIRRMQRDMEKSRMQDAKQRQLEEANKKMRLRIQVSINLLLPPHLHSLSLSSCYYLPPLSVFILLPPHLPSLSLSSCYYLPTSCPLSVFMLLPPHLPSLSLSSCYYLPTSLPSLCLHATTSPPPALSHFFPGTRTDCTGSWHPHSFPQPGDTAASGSC